MLNIFLHPGVIQELANLDYTKEGDYTGDIFIEMIDTPLTIHVESTDTERKFTAYVRDEMKTNSRLHCQATFQKGADISQDDCDNTVWFMLLAWMLPMKYLIENDVLIQNDSLEQTDTGVEILLINGKVSHRIVSGKQRPVLICTTLFGGTGMCRPYDDEIMEGIAMDSLSLDALIHGAEAGNTDMMDRLYHIYLNGENNTPADVEQAVYWVKKWADAGSEIGQFNLGLHYAKGYGVPRDFAKAAEWMKKAAENGDTDAPGCAEQYSSMVELQKNAEAGDAQAQAELAGALMMLGSSMDQAGPGRDYEESVKWARKAAAQGNGEGMWILALAYRHGRSVEKNIHTAIDWYTKGVEKGHAGCMHNLGCEYMSGETLKKDSKHAFELILKAAQLGNGLAMRDVGRCYQFGDGVEENMSLAIEWYEKALEIIDDDELRRKVNLFKGLEDGGAFDNPDEYEDDFVAETVQDPWGILSSAVTLREQVKNGTYPEFGMDIQLEPRKPGEKPGMPYIEAIENGYRIEDLCVERTQYEGRLERIEHLREGENVKIIRSSNDNEQFDVLNHAGESIGIVRGYYFQQVLDAGLGELINGKVSYVVPRSKRGPRAKKADLYVTVDLVQKQVEEIKSEDGCVIYLLGGDQTQIWMQELQVIWCSIPLKEAKLLFEVYNRIAGEYEKISGGNTDTSYAGLDNLADEIQCARKKMKAEMRQELSYSSKEETWEFDKALRNFIDSEGNRYASLRKYVGQGSTLKNIFLKNVINKRDYFWIDETRVNEMEFKTSADSFNHWYEIAELMDPGNLPFDPDDREMTSIFGFDRFVAFADLSYGC